jgi:hypothetical protein
MREGELGDHGGTGATDEPEASVSDAAPEGESARWDGVIAADLADSIPANATPR